jgi:hypothetical protein
MSVGKFGEVIVGYFYLPVNSTSFTDKKAKPDITAARLLPSTKG